MPIIELLEWSTQAPDVDSVLYKRSFDGAPKARLMAEQLTEKVVITEQRCGLSVSTSSFVGTLTVGDLQIVIKPKIAFNVLKVLFQYAYGLHRLHLYEHFQQAGDRSSFQDLLIQQLAAEGERLLKRGIHRQYQRVHKPLAIPRGRIDLQKVARNGGVGEARLPCTYYERSENNVLNIALHAGLCFATSLTNDLAMRAHLRRLAAMIVSPLKKNGLSAHLLQDAYQALTRLTSAYAPIIDLIALLYAGTGMDFAQNRQIQAPLPGFLFDMNNFFEVLVTRFLMENLPTYQVQAQYRLRDMLSYDPSFNPLRKKSPTPRPDIALLRSGKVVALIDAKYRDLWTHSLPRDMLYQLAIYALSQTMERQAIMLYPVTSNDAAVQVIEIHDPVHVRRCARIVMNPIHLPTLANLLEKPGIKGVRERYRYAEHLVRAIS